MTKHTDTHRFESEFYDVLFNFMKDFIPFHVAFIGRKEINAAKRAILNRTITGNGPLGIELEERFKKYTNSKYALFTTSCTSCIEIALIALGIQKGQEVMIPSFSFVSVANAVARLGAYPRFVEIDEDTLNIAPSQIKRTLNRKTRAIIPVHYAGNSCSMDEILSIARKFNIKVIEDAAQGVGSFFKGKHLGVIGDAGCISLHGTKNITCGEGGIFLTNNKRIAKIADIIREKGTNRSLFLKGRIDAYSWILSGSSYVQSDILAAIAIEQLEKIDWVNKRRRQIATYLNNRLAGFNPVIRRPRIIPGAETNWHIYAIIFRDKKARDLFIEKMGKRKIECTPHFVPLHTSSFAQKYLGYRKRDFPITEKVCNTLVRLPIYPQLARDDVEYISSCTEEVLASL